ncbi:hypothetical protein LPJ66_008278, partial [Kickxella alabastrina]
MRDTGSPTAEKAESTDADAFGIPAPAAQPRAQLDIEKAATIDAYGSKHTELKPAQIAGGDGAGGGLDSIRFVVEADMRAQEATDKPADGAYAWMVIFACLISLMLSIGINDAYG